MKSPPKQSTEEVGEIKTPRVSKYGLVSFSVEISPQMYRNLVRASRKLFTRVDLAQIVRFYLQKGIINDVPSGERE